MRSWILLFVGATRLCEGAEVLSLSEAVARALETHPSVASAQASLNAAAAKIDVAKAGWKPRVDYQESWVRSNNPVFVFGSLLTQRQFTAANFGLDSLNRPEALNQFQSLVSAEQVLWDAGRTGKRVELAQADRKLSLVGKKQVELAVASRAARAYLDAQLSLAAVPVAEQALAQAQADLRLAQTIYDAGRSTAADVLSAKVHVAMQQEMLVQRRAEARIAVEVLRDLVGAGPDVELSLAPEIGVSAKPVAVAAGVRPDVEREQVRREIAETQIGLSRLAVMPQVSAQIGGEVDRQRFVNRAGANWMMGVSLRWTPYQGGAERANIRAASEMLRAAQAEEKGAMQRARLEQIQAETLVGASLARVSSAEASIGAAEESLRITKDRYEAGLGNLTDLLRTEVALTEAKLRLLLARHGVRTSQLNLAVAQGELKADSEVLQ
jgi:outer membrane protein